MLVHLRTHITVFNGTFLAKFICFNIGAVLGVACGQASNVNLLFRHRNSVVSLDLSISMNGELSTEQSSVRELSLQRESPLLV